MAMWLRQPSSVCYTVVFHAISWSIPSEQDKVHIVQKVERLGPLHCHPDDVSNQVTYRHLEGAAELHEALLSVPRNNRVWEASRAFWAA